MYSVSVSAADPFNPPATQGVTITVKDVNQSPVAINDSAMVTEDESSRIDLVNNSEGKDLDPESDDWTVEITRNPINGNAHVESDQ